MYKYLAIIAIFISFFYLPIAIQAQNAPTTPNYSVTTPSNSGSIIEQKETTDSAEQPDFKLLKKALLVFYQSNRIQVNSDTALDISASGIKAQINMTMATVVETGNKFNSQIIFTNPQSTPIKFMVISNGQKVWIYRPDKRVYRETTLAKFDKERFLVGMSATIFSKIPEKDRLSLVGNTDPIDDNSLGGIFKSLPVKDIKGERVQIEDRSLYAFSVPAPGDFKFTGIVRPGYWSISSTRN